jgi:PadR family transcriptional regulator PadR
VLAARGTLHHIVPADTSKLLSQLRRGAIKYCVLALLQDGDMYGFELTRSLADAGGLVTSEGTVYPLLARLRHEGLVTTTWQESAQGPPRRYYRLTDAGREALAGFRQEWHRFRDSIDTVLNEGGEHGRSGRRGDSDPVLS